MAFYSGNKFTHREGILKASMSESYGPRSGPYYPGNLLLSQEITYIRNTKSIAQSFFLKEKYFHAIMFVVCKIAVEILVQTYYHPLDSSNYISFVRQTIHFYSVKAELISKQSF